MKKHYCYLIAALMTIGCISCSDNDTPNSEPIVPGAPTASQGAYVVTQGNYYSGIEGGLNVLNFESGVTDQNVFKATNNRSLGDTPQCGVAYGSKIYIGTSTSNTIEVIDRLTWKSIKKILVSDYTSKGQPYSMVVRKGKVFIAMFGGSLARLDTLSLTIDSTVDVGDNPDQIALYKDRIFIPISEGMNYPNYGKSAVVVNPETMTIEKTFETGLNPRNFIVADNKLFLLCAGNYGDIPSRLYQVNDDNTVREICEATIISPLGKDVAIINQPFIEGQPVIDYKIYSPSTGELKDWNIERPDYANNMFYNEATGQLLISSYIMNGMFPNYDLPGYVNLYNTDGKTIAKKFNLGSGGPACIFTHQK